MLLLLHTNAQNAKKKKIFVSLGVTLVTFIYPEIPTEIEQVKAVLCVKQGRRSIAEKVTIIKLRVVVFCNKAFLLWRQLGALLDVGSMTFPLLNSVELQRTWTMKNFDICGEFFLEKTS